MINFINNRRVRSSLALIMILSMLSLATPVTFAMPNDKGGESAEAVSESDSSMAVSVVKSPDIAYVLYKNSISFEPHPAEGAAALEAPKPVDPQVFATKNIVSKRFPALPPPPAASTAPMTAGEKFNLFLQRSFVPPGPYIQSVFTGMFNELRDNNEGKEDTVGDFFADSMTRAARSFGNRVANNFFEKFALATIFKQDPRYHRSGKSSAGGKIGHAVSRIFITQGDRGGDQFNVSFLLGGLMGAGVANVWERDERRTVGKTFSRWGTHILLTTGANIIREFVGGQ